MLSLCFKKSGEKSNAHLVTRQPRQMVGPGASKKQVYGDSLTFFLVLERCVLPFERETVVGSQIQILRAGVGRPLLLWLPFVYEYKDVRLTQEHEDVQTLEETT